MSHRWGLLLLSDNHQMTATELEFLPGDVLAVDASKGLGILSGGWWIKLRNWLNLMPKRSRFVDHIVVVHHRDSTGTLWGIEGRPSAVGWVDCAIYLDHGDLVADNRAQPKTQVQRDMICKVAEEMLGTPYDWEAIAKLGVDTGFINKLWNKTMASLALRDWDKDEVPGHVICSSYAALVYQKSGLDHPVDSSGGCRFVDPDDWSEFIFKHIDSEGVWA